MSRPWVSKRKSVVKQNDQLYLPVRDRREFDDDILHANKRIKMVTKGYSKQIGARNIHHGVPWEYFCRSVTMLDEFYSHEGTNVALRDGIIESAHICATLSPQPTLRMILNSGMDIGLITGVVYVPYLVAWCALCQLAHGEPFDCVNLWKDDAAAVEIIKTCFKSFDKLEKGVYTDLQVFGIAKHHYGKD